jgi:hypothetical protein
MEFILATVVSSLLTSLSSILRVVPDLICMQASVPNWLKEELLKKKAAVAGGAQLTGSEDNLRANGDNVEASTHNKFELSDRSRSDLSRMSDSDDEDEEVRFKFSSLQ